MRPEKNLIIDEIKTRVDRAPYVLLTDYTGMHVEQFNELRNRLSGAHAEFRVVKNNLLRRALAGLEPSRSGDLPARAIGRRARRRRRQRRGESPQELHRRVPEAEAQGWHSRQSRRQRGADHGPGRPAVEEARSRPSSSAFSSRRPRNWCACSTRRPRRSRRFSKLTAKRGKRLRHRRMQHEREHL